jgi:hypothetical protein
LSGHRGIEHTRMSPERLASLALVALCFSHLTAIVQAAECADDSFSRPFSYLSDANITNFLDANPSLPVALNDVRFVRFADEHQILIRGLIIPSLYDQRVTMIFARLHSYTSLRIDPALDKLIDTIDDISWASFFIQFLVAPSYPLYRTISQISSDSSIDEWLQAFFLILSVIEAFRFAVFVLKVRMTYQRPQTVGLAKVSLWRVLTRQDRNLHWTGPIRNFACVAVLSAFSYFVLWRFASDHVSLLISNFFLFALPAWYLIQAYTSVTYVMQLRHDIMNHKKAKLRIPVKMIISDLRNKRRNTEMKEKLAALKDQLQSYEATAEVQSKTHADLSLQIKGTAAKIAVLEQLPPPSAGATSNREQLDQVTLEQQRARLQELETARNAMEQEMASTKNKISKVESDAKSLEEALEKTKAELSKSESDKVDLIKILKSKCIQFEQIELGKFLGNGHFGYVLQAKFFGEGVAIKFGQSHDPSAVSEFLMEVCMSQTLFPTFLCFFVSLKFLLNESPLNLVFCRSPSSLNCVILTSSASWELSTAMEREALAFNKKTRKEYLKQCFSPAL